MKRIIALLIIAATVTALASCNVKEQILDNTTTEYVSAAETIIENLILPAEREILRSLVNSQANLIEDVFVLSHLPVDESAAITHNGAKYAPVTDKSSIKTYAELLDILNATYTEDAVKEMLGNPPVYIELEGKLYFNLDYSSGYFDGENLYPYDWSDFEIVTTSGYKEKNKITFCADVTDANQTNGSKVWVTMEAINVDGNWKLTKFISDNK